MSDITGPTGATGPKGETGERGDQGFRGPIGVQGDSITGPIGPDGVTGVPGVSVTGASGGTGNSGETGPIGVTGVQGASGPSGAIGNTGAGVTGPTGGTAGNTGPTGASGSTGSIGASGPTGSVGSQGNVGNVGIQGETGHPGNQGETGIQGVVGPAGPAGGPTGDTGPEGVVGSTGPIGPAGGITAHNDLDASSLLLDDHPQYFLADGSRFIDNNADAILQLVLDSGISTTQRTDIVYLDQGVEQWRIGKNTSNNFQWISQATGNAIMTMNRLAAASSIAIDANGRVGIGTSLPATKLHVLGNARITGNDLRVDSDADVDTTITIDSGQSFPQHSHFVFADRGSEQWLVCKPPDNTLFIKHVPDSTPLITFRPGFFIDLDTSTRFQKASADSMDIHAHAARHAPGGADPLIPSVPRGYLSGMVIRNSTLDPINDLIIGAGVARDAGDTTTIISQFEVTKQLDATWAKGNKAGGLSAGVSGGLQWYHIFAMGKSTGSVFDSDFGFDSSATGVNLKNDPVAVAAGFDKLRRIGSLRCDLGIPNAWVPFSQLGDVFRLNIPELSNTITNAGTTFQKRTVFAPPGIEVIWNGVVAFYYTANSGEQPARFAIVGSGNATALSVPSSTSFDLAAAGDIGSGSTSFPGMTTSLGLLTNTSQEVSFRWDGTGPALVMHWMDHGYTDNRGKDE